jgi:glucose-6-phosphate isomerase
MKNSKIKIKNKKGREIRYLYNLKEVLYDKNWFKKSKNFPVYYIHRDVKEETNLRYDITIIPPKLLGKEFVKTKGHFHFGNFGELYRVLRGEGIFLIQKGKDKIEDFYFIRAKRGEYVKIPPGYGHATVNPSKKILKLANWVSKNCLSDYKSVEKKGGMCYYYTLDGWIRNKKYKKVPKIKEKKPLKKKPKNLNFLYAR